MAYLKTVFLLLLLLAPTSLRASFLTQETAFTNLRQSEKPHLEFQTLFLEKLLKKEVPQSQTAYGLASLETETSPQGAYSAQYRHVRPGLGRWIKRDPGGFIDGPNRYRWNRNNPFKYVDPSGLEPFNSSGLLAEPKFLPGGTPNPNFVPFTSGNPSDFAFSNRQLANGAAFGTGVGIGVLTPPLPLAQATLLVLGSSAIELKVFDLVRGEDSSLQEFGLNGLYALGGEAIGIGLRAFGRTGARYLGLFDEACELGVAGSIRDVNPTGGTRNCVNCSIATDSTLAGFPASAVPSRTTDVAVLEQLFSRKFSRPTSKSAIENALIKAGPGARGIVFGSRIGKPGHVFNVVNQNGTIRFLDGQTGRAATFPNYFSLHLLRTD